jgi:hypothetical protein
MLIAMHGRFSSLLSVLLLFVVLWRENPWCLQYTNTLSTSARVRKVITIKNKVHHQQGSILDSPTKHLSMLIFSLCVHGWARFVPGSCACIMEVHTAHTLIKAAVFA